MDSVLDLKWFDLFGCRFYISLAVVRGSLADF